MPRPRSFRSWKRRSFVLIPALLLLCKVSSASAPSETAFPFPLGIEKTEAVQPMQEAALPVRLRMPTIGVDAPIIGVGLVGENDQLDVPEDLLAVGWYNLGPRPGEKGNSVLDGHLDRGKQNPGIFTDLHRVQIGDVLTVEDESGKKRRFRVKDKQVYHVLEAPMEKIFGGSSGKNLNLITCAGVWREEFDHYDERLVVFSELIDDRPKVARKPMRIVRRTTKTARR